MDTVTVRVSEEADPKLRNYKPPREDKLKQGMMAFQLSSTQAREWVQKTRESVKPWAEFLNYTKVRAPKGPGPLTKRFVKNIDRFQGNYVFVFIILVIVCILTSPMLIVAIAACLGACYIISVKNQQQKLKILGRELTLAQQYSVVGVCSFPLFWIAGAGSAVFWIIGASFFVIGAHAGFYAIEEETLFEEVEMDPV